MADLLSAGVFIEERATDAQVIEAVSSSTVGMVGFSPRGPTDRARLITSLDEYFQVFGAFTKRSLLGTQMLAFFQNGGRRAYVVRVVPSDATSGDAQVQNEVAEQQIETGDGAATVYSKTAGTSPILDNGGLTQVVPSGISIIYRAAATAVTAQRVVTDAGTAFLTTATGVAAYSGRVDPKSTRLVAGATSDGSVYYRSVQDARQDIQVAHVDPGAPNIPLSVAVAGTTITVTLATDGASAITSTGTLVAAAVNANTSAAALVTAAINGTGSGIAAAAAAAPLLGVPVFHGTLLRVIPGTLTITWQGNAGTRTIAFTGGDLDTPIATKTNGAGSTVRIDLRSGRLSLLTHSSETPILADNGARVTVSYTPTSATVTVTTTGSVDASTGKLLLAGSTLDTPTLSNNFFNILDGAYTLTFTAGAANIPSQRTPVLATYKTNVWDLDPVSKGAWSSDVRLRMVGNVESYEAATASYGLLDVTVEQINSATGNFEPVERYEEVSFTDPDSGNFFPDVLNQLSDLILVNDPGVHTQPRQLSGVSRSAALGGGNNAAAGTTPKTIVDVTVPYGPVAPRTVVVSYTDSNGTARSITDDGAGNLTGAVNPSYAAVAASGLAANRIDYTTGEVNVQTLYGVLAGTLVTVAYYSAPTTATQLERFGDTTKAYSYVYNSVTYSFYTAGSDGTFTASTFSRSQFTSPALQASASGMYAFDRVDEILQLVIPDFAGDATVSQDMIAYAEQRATLPHGGDRFVILTVPRGSSAQEAVDWVRFTLGVKSKYAAVYWPWVRFADPLNNNRPTVTPPLGHIAGVYARTDATKNVGKAPAGTVDGALQGITGLEMDPTQGERDTAYPARVNPLISTPQTGRAVWGSRTLAATTEWRNINAVRLFMFAEKSTYNSTFWVVFENNGPALWARMKTQLVGFFDNLFNDGYFAGRNASEAYFVTVDETNNTGATRALGQVITDIGLAPNKPAEFVRYRFQQLTAN